jgi:hypothetical protein
MSAKKFLRNVAGVISEIVATVVSSGAANDGDIVALDSTGKLDLSVMPVGVTPTVATIQASENLAAGAFVNVWNSAGSVRVRNADGSTTGKDVDGFVLSAVTSGQNATVYFTDVNTQLTGLTVGSDYYLSDTSPGGVVSTAPTGAGKTSQFVGEAVSTTAIVFNPGPPITLA